VSGVSFARVVPFMGYTWDWSFSVPGGKDNDIWVNSVGPDYFGTMRIPLLEGRDFAWNDTSAGGMKVILNQKAAALLFPGGDALGHEVKQNNGSDEPAVLYQVVGVVGNAKYEDLHSDPPPTAYTAMTQDNDGRRSPSYYAVVRTSGDAGSLATAARVLAKRMAPGVPAPVMTSMMTTVDDSLSAERMMALLSVFFAGCALLVTAIGLYGTLAYATARRTSEIGIRMALGARRGLVVRMILRQVLVLAAVGLAIGLPVALGTSKLVASFLYGMKANDARAMAGAVGILLVAATLAGYAPARRASRIDPTVALRHE
jgi:predicted permease